MVMSSDILWFYLLITKSPIRKEKSFDDVGHWIIVDRFIKLDVDTRMSSFFRVFIRHGSSMIKVIQLDHLVLTVADINRTNEFYQRILGMKSIKANGRWSLQFGIQKINLHLLGHEFEPKAARPTPGSADLCFLTETPMTKIVEHLQQSQINIIEGPVHRIGAHGSLFSVYFRDPDLNLIEVANQLIEKDTKWTRYIHKLDAYFILWKWQRNAVIFPTNLFLSVASIPLYLFVCKDVPARRVEDNRAAYNDFTKSISLIHLCFFYSMQKVFFTLNVCSLQYALSLEKIVFSVSSPSYRGSLLILGNRWTILCNVDIGQHVNQP